jgi:hypothetical protein
MANFVISLNWQHPTLENIIECYPMQSVYLLNVDKKKAINKAQEIFNTKKNEQRFYSVELKQRLKTKSVHIQNIKN